ARCDKFVRAELQFLYAISQRIDADPVLFGHISELGKLLDRYASDPGLIANLGNAPRSVAKSHRSARAGQGCEHAPGKRSDLRGHPGDPGFDRCGLPADLALRALGRTRGP